MDLHLGAPVAETPGSLPHRSGNVAFAEQPLVQLGRRHVRDHRALGGDRVARRREDTGRASRLHDDTLDVDARLTRPAVVSDQLHERVGELRTSAARDRHATVLHCDRDHLRHETRRRSIGTEARVQHPRREEAVGALRGEALPQPGAARLQHRSREVRYADHQSSA